MSTYRKYNLVLILILNGNKKDKSYYEIKSRLTDWRKLFDQAKYLKSNWSTPKYQMCEFRGHKKG